MKAMPGVQSVMVALTAEKKGGAPGARPPQGAPARGAAPRGEQGPQGVPGVTSIIAVASGKGGVGKSTVPAILRSASPSSDLRSAFSTPTCSGHQCPSCSASIPSRSIAPDGKRLIPLESVGVKVMSIGFLIDEGAPVVWRGPMVVSALNQLLREVVWGELDVLVVDMPPGTGDTQLTMAQNVPLAGAVIVSTPQDLALIDARRGIAMFNQVKIPILGVVENMSYFVCPHCGGRTTSFRTVGRARRPKSSAFRSSAKCRSTSRSARRPMPACRSSRPSPTAPCQGLSRHCGEGAGPIGCRDGFRSPRRGS